MRIRTSRTRSTRARKRHYADDSNHRSRRRRPCEDILRFAAIVAVICALGVAAPSALAQQSVDVGSVSGRVTDQSGAVVTDAQVTALQTQTNLTTTTTTDQDGRFRLPYRAEAGMSPDRWIVDSLRGARHHRVTDPERCVT